MDKEPAAEAAPRIEVHEEPAWRRVIDVEIPSSRVEAAYAEVYRRYQKSAKLPGFRPGKVPLAIIEKRFSDQADRDVLDALIPDTLLLAYREHSLVPITDPELSLVKLQRGLPMRYRAAVEVRPRIDPSGYTGLLLHKRPPPVRDEHVEQTIERIRERRAELHPSPAAAVRGDVVLCDLVETGEALPRRELTDVTLELNPERVYPEIADGLLGTQPGDRRQIRMTYPDDHGDAALAGRTVQFEVTVKEVRARRLPDLDAAFFSTLAGEIRTLEELRGRVRADLEEQSQDEARRVLHSEIIGQVVARNPFELPGSLIRDYLDRLHADLQKTQPQITAEEVDARYRELGTRQVRWEFLYHAIAKKEALEVSEDDVDQWLARLAEHRGMGPDEVKSQLGGAAAVARIRDHLLERKVLDFLMARATVTELPAEGRLVQPPGASPNPRKRK